MSELHTYGESPEDFAYGDRIETHPATDQWIRGERFGTVVKVGKLAVKVKMDRTGRTYRALPKNLRKVN